MHLAELPLNQPATIAAIDWVVLGETATRRLRALGFDAGVIVETLHTADSSPAIRWQCGWGG